MKGFLVFGLLVIAIGVWLAILVSVKHVEHPYNTVFYVLAGLYICVGGIFTYLARRRLSNTA